MGGRGAGRRRRRRWRRLCPRPAAPGRCLRRRGEPMLCSGSPLRAPAPLRRCLSRAKSGACRGSTSRRRRRRAGRPAGRPSVPSATPTAPSSTTMAAPAGTRRRGGGGGGLALGVAGLGGDGRGPPVLPRSPPGPRGAAPSTAAGTPRGEPGSARQDPRPAFPPPFPWPEPGRKVSATLPGPVWGPPRTPLRAASPGEWGSERLPGRRGCLEIPELFPVVSFVGKGWMLPLRRA